MATNHVFKLFQMPDWIIYKLTAYYRAREAVPRAQEPNPRENSGFNCCFSFIVVNFKWFKFLVKQKIAAHWKTVYSSWTNLYWLTFLQDIHQGCQQTWNFYCFNMLSSKIFIWHKKIYRIDKLIMLKSI